jgi:phage terminase large subunit-like protein
VNARAALSKAEQFATLSLEERKEYLSGLKLDDTDYLEYSWPFWGRPSQLPPEGDWHIWLLLGGRGLGKTRTGAEWIRSIMCGPTPLAPGLCRHVALVGETAADVRKVMVGSGLAESEGAGILQVHPAAFRPVYNPSNKRLTWPNGAIATLYNATQPEELRGPSHGAAWADELCKWTYLQDTWDNLEFGLRLGTNPRIVITTTPKPIKELKQIMADPTTVVTRGSTYENIGNLPKKFIDRMASKYEGTRLGRQELHAEILDDAPGALWKRSLIEEARIKFADLPELTRIVVAIDPSATSGEDADEAGVICAALGRNGHLYVLEDASKQMAPVSNDPDAPGWANVAIEIYRRRKADRVVAEVNNGGEMVEATLRMVDPRVSYRAVHASRGKVIRAEPVAALYEQKRVHHVGMFAALEDQMTAFTTDFDRKEMGYSPDRVDALVWAITELAVDMPAGFGLLEFMREESENLTRLRLAPAAGEIVVNRPAEIVEMVRMRAPANASGTIFGVYGDQYHVVDGMISVKRRDVEGLARSGFVEIKPS